MESDYPTLFLMLSALAALGRFAAFALEPFGTEAAPKVKEAKKQEEDAARSGGDVLPERVRVSFSRVGLEALWEFFANCFGAPPRFRSNPDLGTTSGFVRGILWKVTATSAFVVLGVFVFSNALDDTSWTAPAEGTLFFPAEATAGSSGPEDQAGDTRKLIETLGGMAFVTAMCFFALILANTIAETISLAVTWWSLGPFADRKHEIQSFRPRPWSKLSSHFSGNRSSAQEKKNPSVAVLFGIRLPIALVLSYLCFLFAMNVAFSIIVTIRGVVSGYLTLWDWPTFWVIQGNIFWSETLPRALHPIAEGSSISVGNTSLLAFCLLPLLPAAMLLVTLVATLLLEAIDLTSNGAVTRRLGDDGHRAGPAFWLVLVLVIGGLATVGLTAMDASGGAK